MSHPKFEYVFRDGCLAAANVPVHIDKAGHQVHAFTVEFFATGLELDPVGIAGHTGCWKPHAGDGDDPVLPYHYIYWTDRWCTGAIDQHDASNDQVWERPFAFLY